MAAAEEQQPDKKQQNSNKNNNKNKNKNGQQQEQSTAATTTTTTTTTYQQPRFRFENYLDSNTSTSPLSFFDFPTEQINTLYDCLNQPATSTSSSSSSNPSLLGLTAENPSTDTPFNPFYTQPSTRPLGDNHYPLLINPITPITPSFTTNLNQAQAQAQQQPFLDIQRAQLESHHHHPHQLGSIDPLQTISSQLHYPGSRFKSSSEADVFNTSQPTTNTHPLNHHPPLNSLQVVFPPISPATSQPENDNQTLLSPVPSTLKTPSTSTGPTTTTTTTASNPMSFHPQSQNQANQNQANRSSASINRPKSPKSKPMSHMLSQDFRRRKDWHKRLVEDVMDVLQVIGPTGELLFVSESMARLTGFTTSELLGAKMSSWCYEDEDRSNLDREISNCFKDGSAGLINFYCRFKKKRSTGYVIFEMMGHMIRVKTNPGYLRGEPKNEKQVIIINARPYPTSCGRLTDEFLELMLENEAMKRLIDSRVGVGTSEEEEGGESTKQADRTSGSGSGTTARIEAGGEAAESSNKKKKKTEEPDEPAEEDSHHAAKDSDPEDDVHPPLPLSAPPLEPVDSAQRTRVRGPNKRERVDFLCLDCGVTQSPEWRKGPMGRKTLCNACGLRYAKKAK
ncbi:blue light receptor [Puccinia graminis f. sp. tritici]|uniref:Blue light receptor n=1 Tax=Puccinia graminis f. sp. tritici TaxID=56615 RepID=A0A5B0LWF3_PUCGR|nr:blue light receptor [Puccinia graminis f. sp. tritici]KAA1104590.1 blue light receptor [Puccinia graminis f. sp. tritici]